MAVSTATVQLSPDQLAAIERVRARFTPAELAEAETRQRESARLIARLVATETLEEQQRLADQLCPSFDAWVRARNRIRSTPTRRPRVVTMIRPVNRTRERRPGSARRAGASSRTSSADPGDPDPDPEPPARLRHISGPLARLLDELEGRAA